MKFKHYDRMESYRKSVGYTGIKNKIKFDIAVYRNYGYCVFVEDKVSNNSYNSLWKGITFDTHEQAFEWCEKLADFYKDKRIPNEGKGETGHEKCNNKIDEFLESLEE